MLARDPLTSAQLPNRSSPPALCFANSGQRHYRSDLNNLANKYRLKLQYEDKCEGPPHNCSWTSTAYINEIPYGSGNSRDKGGARERASKAAVEALESQGYTI
ncbi:hypothetical protein LshimejAT787_1800470 [Lyophyllum shimeji]|uniref:DRBM domain-containing protein n=1 Tax=Lyophyllum shimeji TaxID=47721 RepID=A0A9P3UUG4_LYOSH|nr:hypothetical protein LshimejAT787_1800470 [Lyophyllum shimeji]